MTTNYDSEAYETALWQEELRYDVVGGPEADLIVEAEVAVAEFFGSYAPMRLISQMALTAIAKMRYASGAARHLPRSPRGTDPIVDAILEEEEAIEARWVSQHP